MWELDSGHHWALSQRQLKLKGTLVLQLKGTLVLQLRGALGTISVCMA